uniref:Membrane protein BRI3 n=1 Tax=Oryctolagus cuniculus TaxID=9986 RepID=A0A5F9DJ90_RABIT
MNESWPGKRQGLRVGERKALCVERRRPRETFACGPHGYSTIPTAPPPQPYPYLVTVLPTHHPRVYNHHSQAVTRYPANSIEVVGSCLVCRVGVLEDCFTFLGIFWAIILLPFGFICCFALKKRRCPNCGATFA